MSRIISEPIEPELRRVLAEEIGGFYIKVVVDIDKRIMVAGAKMHVDEEQALLSDGSEQKNLWGGGYDLETKQITFDSIINNKPDINASSDILDPVVRKKFEFIVKILLNV